MSLTMATNHNAGITADISRLSDEDLGKLLDGPGGSEALDEIHRRHAGSALAAARRRLGDTPRAEEVVQEVFLDLWMRPQRYDRARGSLAAFLAVQANSRALDRIRADSSRQRRDEQEARMSRRVSDSTDDVESRLLVGQRVRGALAALPDSERVPISLAFYQARTYREVAEVLGVPEGTVKSRIRAGLRRLRDMLAEVADFVELVGIEPVA